MTKNFRGKVHNGLIVNRDLAIDWCELSTHPPRSGELAAITNYNPQDNPGFQNRIHPNINNLYLKFITSYDPKLVVSSSSFQELKPSFLNIIIMLTTSYCYSMFAI